MLERRDGAKQSPAILTGFHMQKLHGLPARTIGSQDAIVKRMEVANKNIVNGRIAGTAGKASWIANELIGIRTLEERLSKKLKARSASNHRMLLNGIRSLNTRVELLDRALDEFSRSRGAA